MFAFLTQKFSALATLFSSKKRLDEQGLQEALLKVEEALLQADVPYQVVKDFTARVRDEVQGHKLLHKVDAGTAFIKIVHEQMKHFLGTQNDFSGFSLPCVVMVLGLQGSGKTTSLAKMAWYVASQAEQRGKKRRILCASVDFSRPAAIDQLSVLTGRVGVDFYRAQATDVVKAAQEIIDAMRKGAYDILFLDTAGRLHVDQALLSELQALDACIKPRHKIFVLDAMTGQESLRVAQAFDEAVGFQAAMLSKIDSDTRGGAAFAFKYVQKKPIFFVGTGEKPEDIELFHPDRVAKKILGMGDVISLAEKAERVIKHEEQEALNKALTRGVFTLQDFANQMNMVDSLGSLSSLARYLPGAVNQITPEMIQKGEQDIKKFKAIISSMTPKERIVPKILTPSRIQRIARGAGAQPADVHALMRRFEESQQYAKLFKRFFRSK